MGGGEGEPEAARSQRFEPDAIAELPLELALAPLPSGRHGLPRPFVSRQQRLRIIAAMLRVLPRHGYHRTTIGHLTEEAGVSRSAFYAQFEGKEECFLATYDLAAEWIFRRVERAAAAEGEWPARVRSGIAEALALLAANPPLAHLLTIEALQAGAAARRRHRSCLAHLAEVLRTDSPRRAEHPVDLEELLLGGAFSLVALYAETGRAAELGEAASELTRCILVPYLEPGETQRIADQAA